MQMIKGAAAGLVALVACPCHLPLTIPALLLLTSGTAAGVWLATNQWFIWTASIALFAGGLGLAFLWMGRAGSEALCEVPQNRQQREHASGTRGASNSQKHLELANQTKEVSHV